MGLTVTVTADEFQSAMQGRDIQDNTQAIVRLTDSMGQLISRVDVMSATMTTGFESTNQTMRLLIKWTALGFIVALVAMFGLVGGSLYISSSAGSVGVNQTTPTVTVPMPMPTPFDIAVPVEMPSGMGAAAEPNREVN